MDKIKTFELTQDNCWEISNGILKIKKNTIKNMKGKYNIIIPEKIGNTEITKINHNAFSDIKNIVSISIPNTVTEIWSLAFEGCSNLENINIPKSIKVINAEAFAHTPWLNQKHKENPFVIINDILIDADKVAEKNIIIPDNVKAIAPCVFMNNIDIISVTIPNSMTEIGFGAFNGCIHLETINLPDSMKEISEGAFENCNNLKSVLLPNEIKRIGESAFSGCGNMEFMLLPHSIEAIEKNAFKNCKSLQVFYNGTNEEILYNGNISEGLFFEDDFYEGIPVYTIELLNDCIENKYYAAFSEINYEIKKYILKVIQEKINVTTDINKKIDLLNYYETIEKSTYSDLINNCQNFNVSER